MVVAAGMVSAPLPAIVPLLQVMAEPVKLMAAEPLSVPPLMVRVGIDCPAALLTVRVPPLTTMPAEIVPVTVLEPPDHCTVPAPLIVEAASKVRVSPVLKDKVAPLEALKVAPVLVTAPT